MSKVRFFCALLIAGVCLLSDAAQAQWAQIPNGGLASEGPALISRSGTVEVYVRGLDNQLWYTYWSSVTGWLPYTSFGGVLSSKPSATPVQNSSMTAIAVRGQDCGFHVRLVGHTTSTPWTRIPGGRFLGAPAVASFDGKLWVFGRGEDQRIWYANNSVTIAANGNASYQNNAWTAWTTISNDGFTSDPGVTVQASKLVVAARDFSRGYNINTTFGSTWSGWALVQGGAYSSEPALSPNSAGNLVVFGRGLDGTYYRNTFNGSTWTGPISLQGGFYSAPSAAFASPQNSMVVVGIGFNESPYLRWVP